MRYADKVADIAPPGSHMFLFQRTELRNKLNHQIAEINALKSLPLNLPAPHTKPAGKSGEVSPSFSRYCACPITFGRASMALFSDLCRRRNKSYNYKQSWSVSSFRIPMEDAFR